MGSGACAQHIHLIPLVDAQPRWDQVDQVHIPRDVEAVTVRIRLGVKADVGPVQALV